MLDIPEALELDISYKEPWDVVKSQLQWVYGERIDWEKSVRNYFNSQEYKENVQVVKRCPDIPIIEQEDIQKMLQDEQEYCNKIQELLECYNEFYSREHTVDEEKEYIFKAAGLLGILPEKNGNALYSWLIDRSNMEDQEISALNAKILEHRQEMLTAIDLLTRFFIPGMLLRYPAPGVAMTQQKRRYYYRGENAYYRSSKASLYRGTQDHKIPDCFAELIDDLRRCECFNFLDQFDAVHRWDDTHYGEVNYLALAQHYGLKTQMLDISSDLKTSLFFACCKFEKNQWRPLNNNDFEHRSSRLGVKNANGDSRYAVLYRTPTEITDLQWAVSDENTGFNIITPIGYQPFMRCAQQHGYMLLTKDKSYELYQDPLFDKFKFKLTEELCNWIYEEMDKGNKIYPNSDIPDISNYIEPINSSKKFSCSVFQEVMKSHKVPEDKWQMFQDNLSLYGVTIGDELEHICKKDLERINKQYNADYAMSKVDCSPQVNPILKLSRDPLVKENDGGTCSLC